MASCVSAAHISPYLDVMPAYKSKAPNRNKTSLPILVNRTLATAPGLGSVWRRAQHVNKFHEAPGDGEINHENTERQKNVIVHGDMASKLASLAPEKQKPHEHEHQHRHQHGDLNAVDGDELPPENCFNLVHSFSPARQFRVVAA